MDVETLNRELTDVRQQLKQREAELEMKHVAMKQQMEESQTLAAQIDRIEHESTAKIEVLCFVFPLSNCTQSTTMRSCGIGIRGEVIKCESAKARKCESEHV